MPRLVVRVAILAAFVVVLAAGPARADDDPWKVSLAGGGDYGFAPAVVGHGFVLVDATRDHTAGGRLHLMYNTDTIQLGLEGVRLAGGKIELAIALRGEALLAGILVDYYQQGRRISNRGFYASYVMVLPSVKWLPASHHSVELVAGVRQWYFDRKHNTAPDLVLPPDAFVFEPRLYYTYWNVHGSAREWAPQTFFPRVTGLAVSVNLGFDVRSNHRAWGANIGGNLDPRNAPGAIILHARQRMLAGVELGSHARLQFEQYGSWGRGEDDLTRNRVGGMNPYVVPIHGMPWAAILSERLLSGQASLHFPVGGRGDHEIGVAISGGTFNDVYRTGALMHFGGAGGVGTFADLRWGGVQVHARVGYLLPAAWELNAPYFSGLITVGAQLR